MTSPAARSPSLYLSWTFDRAVASLPDGVVVTTHPQRAVSVTDDPRRIDRQRVELADGTVLTADLVVLAQGYLDRRASAAEIALTAAAGSTASPTPAGLHGRHRSGRSAPGTVRAGARLRPRFHRSDGAGVPRPGRDLFHGRERGAALSGRRQGTGAVRGFSTRSSLPRQARLPPGDISTRCADVLHTRCRRRAGRRRPRRLRDEGVAAAGQGAHRSPLPSTVRRPRGPHRRNLGGPRGGPGPTRRARCRIRSRRPSASCPIPPTGSTST